MSGRQPIRHGWLLWAATGTTATMNAYRYPPLLSTCLGSFVCLIWIMLNVSTRMLICNFLSGCVDIFFRQVACVGAHKLNVRRRRVPNCFFPIPPGRCPRSIDRRRRPRARA